MKEEITVGFQEIKTNRNGKRYFAKLCITILTIHLNVIVEHINRWLAAPLPSSNHNAAMKKKQPNTGEWFTQSKEFAEWKNGTSSFFWLHGIRRSYLATFSKSKNVD